MLPPIDSKSSTATVENRASVTGSAVMACYFGSRVSRAMNIPRIGTADQKGVLRRIAHRLDISIRALPRRIFLLRWAQSRGQILPSVAYRIRELWRGPVCWSMEFAPNLVGETGYKWTPACTADTLQPLGNIPWTDHLDFEIAVEAWRRGAEWGHHNACTRFDRPGVAREQIISPFCASPVPVCSPTQAGGIAGPVSSTLPVSSA